MKTTTKPIADSSTRLRAVKLYLKKKYLQHEMAEIFGVAVSTFQRWLYRYRSEGSTQLKKRGHRKAVFHGKSLSQLDKRVKKNSDATLAELREMSGQSCSLMSVSRALQRLGYSVKKNAIGSRTKSP